MSASMTSYRNRAASATPAIRQRHISDGIPISLLKQGLLARRR
jgi:hypothetical protein